MNWQIAARGATIVGLLLAAEACTGIGAFRPAPRLPDTAPNAEITPAASAQLSLTNAEQPAPTGVNHHQYFDKKHKRYYYFDPAQKKYFWEDGTPK
jgi:hypothetical protein